MSSVGTGGHTVDFGSAGAAVAGTDRSTVSLASGTVYGPARVGECVSLCGAKESELTVLGGVGAANWTPVRTLVWLAEASPERPFGFLLLSCAYALDMAEEWAEEPETDSW